VLLKDAASTVEAVYVEYEEKLSKSNLRGGEFESTITLHYITLYYYKHLNEASVL